MAKCANQKVKLLCLLEMLHSRTDDEHDITMEEIIEELRKKHQIEAERKSIYDDITCLKEFGYDIVMRKSKRTGYALANRKFQLAELKLLVDAVQASKFITQRKSNDLIRKLAGMTSKYEARELEREVHVKNRVKTMNESIYYNVDSLHNAINNNKKISFQYTQWNINKELKLKKDGKEYVVSPWELTWDDENYYMVAFDEENDSIKHYRVDKMKKINMLEIDRVGKEHFKNFNIADYSKKTFGMFGGNSERITIKFPNAMIGPIIDRFGKDITIEKLKNESFMIKTDIVVSNQFYGWLSGLGAGVKILKPIDVANGYKNYLKSLLQEYK
ncbi:helix-turn-helix transcriptional regulator [Fusobacterium sp. PH5-44]|uniref:helix-turn-helix transcriptional regulator n=1 Tax=unclassified Fusobacterium TaxID=2648384 RepID=UPI003D22B282